MPDWLNHQKALAKHIVNLPEGGRVFLAQLRDEASAQHALTPKVQAVEDVLQARISDRALFAQWPQTASDVLTICCASPFGELVFFSVFIAFGSPQNISLASLRVEHICADDVATRAAIAQKVL